MRTASSIVPRDEDVYLVEVDLRHWGRVWTEADSEATDFETVISDLLAGQHRNPIRIVAFNVSERWSRDVSEDVAIEIRRRCGLQMRDIPFFLQDFVDQYEGQYHDVQLPLPMRLA